MFITCYVKLIAKIPAQESTQTFGYPEIQPSEQLKSQPSKNLDTQPPGYPDIQQPEHADTQPSKDLSPLVKI
ncbi:hypothetical protein H6G81_30040 [Scytonema hofmannii FACHB-248]|uniref:Uncharacterized protein n=1 Tax=Scytonema hofmannii FACHB-248 TaxID=1842502 RepID=A0ABR8GYM8_9CYAN|nr:MULTISPECIES: hypothetical protein [Nostocales]MBD2608642.1 hypothetical protein [Scytonema hofmannii FACHB-248]